ncbi:hypothetical protein [Parvularcula bermudensis]|uniref:hypothetical protein n=1 Tax=Parvularcula bermudensis TaxID=208216 RepID=UPI00032482B9|nr:hypothetical protein [Parvularcula bermudensis]
MQKLKDRETALTISAGKRRRVALTAVSDEGAKILRDDFERQEEFRNAENLKVDFVDDAIIVDGKNEFCGEQ